MLGGIEPSALQTTIRTLEQLSADLVLFRSRPFKSLRSALGPLAVELVGASAQKRRRGGREGTNLDGLDPDSRLKQMDREALNKRVLRAERLQRLEALSQEGDPGTGLLRLEEGAGGSAAQALLQGPAGEGEGADQGALTRAAARAGEVDDKPCQCDSRHTAA